MSCCCCCCCCVRPSRGLPEGVRKKERLVTDREEEEEEAGGGGGEGEQQQARSNVMDISLLRKQYRRSKERQRRHTQVLLFRTVSEELSEAVSIVPVNQGLTSPWEPSRDSPPMGTFDLDLTSYNPWHVHLDLHKRLYPCPIAQLTPSSPEMTNTNSSSRRWSSSTDAVGSRPDAESTAESLGSSRATSPSHCTKEADTGPGPGSSERSHLQGRPAGPLLSRGESATPVVSITCSLSSSTTSLHEDPKGSETSQWGRQTGSTVPQDGSSSACRSSRKFMTPPLSLTRQLSAAGLGSSSTGVHQTQNYHPFPHRKTPRISEAAKRLGMYSSV